MSRSISVGACVLAFLLSVGAAFAQAPARFCGGFGGSGTPVIKPIIYPKLNFDRSDPGFDCQMWQAFVYLNWPAMPGPRGVPNPNAKFGTPGTTVWETYKTTGQTFLAEGRNPGPWTNVASVSALVPQSFSARVATGSLRALSDKSKISPLVIANLGAGGIDPTILSNVTQAFGGTLFDQNKQPVYYEIAVNEDEYNYIVKNGLFNADTQLTFAQSNTIILPAGVTTYGNVGAIELKAAWKILSTAESKSNRFHTAQAIIVATGGTIQQVTVGLVGLHIFQMLGDSNQGVWATFAQVDNAPVQGAPTNLNAHYNFNNPSCTSCSVNDPTTNPTQVVQMFPDDSSADTVNKNMKTLILQENPSSVWQYYKLVNVQWPLNPIQLSSLPAPVAQPLPTDTPNTTTLANAVLETFMQQSGTSCIGCHIIARVSQNQSTKKTPPPQNATSYSFVFANASAPKKP